MRDAGGSMQWVPYGMFRVAGDEWGNTWYTDNESQNLPIPLLPANEWKVEAFPSGDEWGTVSYRISRWQYVPNMVPSELWEAFARYNQSNSDPHAIARYTFELAAPFRGEPFNVTLQELIDATPNFYYNVARPQSNSGYTEGSNYRVIAAYCVKDALNAKNFEGEKWYQLPEVQAYIARGAAEGISRWQATQEDDGDFGFLIAIVIGAAVAVATGGGGITALLGQATAAGEVAAGAALTATEAAAVVEAWSAAEFATAVSTQAFAAEVAASVAVASTELTEAIYAISDVAQNVSTLQDAVSTLTNASAELSPYVAETGDAVLELTSQQLAESSANLADDLVNVSNATTDTIAEIAELQTHVEGVTQSIPEALQDITEIVADTPSTPVDAPINATPNTNAIPPVTNTPSEVIGEIAKTLKISPTTALNVFKMLFAKSGGTPQAPTYARKPNAPSDYDQLLQQYQQSQENYGVGFDLTGITKDLIIPALIVAGAYIATKGK